MTRRIGIICSLVIAIIFGSQLIPRFAAGQGTSFRILSNSYVAVGETLYVLDTTNFPYGWKSIPYGTITAPPIAVSTIAYYDGFHAITNTGEGWGKVSGVWSSLGTIPGTPVQQTTWGQVKSRYLH